MKPIVQIPEPCHEDWQTMSREEQGRFCGKCAHVVMDFTNKSNAEIADYLKANAGHRVCGRVRSEQLVKKSVAPSKPAKRYRTFFAALILVFGGMLFSSCEDQATVGKMYVATDSIPQNDTVTNIPEIKPAFDSTKYLDSVKKADADKKVKTKKRPVIGVDPPPEIMGIMEMPDPTPDTTQIN